MREKINLIDINIDIKDSKYKGSIYCPFCTRIIRLTWQSQKSSYTSRPIEIILKVVKKFVQNENKNPLITQYFKKAKSHDSNARNSPNKESTLNDSSIIQTNNSCGPAK